MYTYSNANCQATLKADPDHGTLYKGAFKDRPASESNKQ